MCVGGRRNSILEAEGRAVAMLWAKPAKRPTFPQIPHPRSFQPYVDGNLSRKIKPNQAKEYWQEQPRGGRSRMNKDAETKFKKSFYQLSLAHKMAPHLDMADLATRTPASGTSRLDYGNAPDTCLPTQINTDAPVGPEGHSMAINWS